MGFDSHIRKAKSIRSYDDVLRRLESWLEQYMRFARTTEGKNGFLSIDSRACRHNPLYAVWKAKSFTDGDITLYFILLDILSSPEVRVNINEIIERVDDSSLCFEEPKTNDASCIAES